MLHKNDIIPKFKTAKKLEQKGTKAQKRRDYTHLMYPEKFSLIQSVVKEQQSFTSLLHIYLDTICNFLRVPGNSKFQETFQKPLVHFWMNICIINSFIYKSNLKDSLIKFNTYRLIID